MLLGVSVEVWAARNGPESRGGMIEPTFSEVQRMVSPVARMLVMVAGGALGVFTIVAALDGSLIKLGIAGLFWMTALVAGVIKFKYESDAPERLEEELKMIKESEQSSDSRTSR